MFRRVRDFRASSADTPRLRDCAGPMAYIQGACRDESNTLLSIYFLSPSLSLSLSILFIYIYICTYIYIYIYILYIYIYIYREIDRALYTT